MYRRSSARRSLSASLTVAAVLVVLLSILPTGVGRAGAVAVPTPATGWPALERSSGTAPRPSLQPTGAWTPINVSYAPSPRWGFTTTYDPAAHEILAWGGVNPTFLGPQTWTYSNGSWANVTSLVGPNPPQVDQMVYDAALGAVVTYGEVSGFSVTYEFSGGVWSNHTAAGGPGPRWRSMMTYDPVDQVVLLFGGENVASTGTFNDTWQFNASGWSQLNPTQSPSVRARAQFTWDPTLGAAVLFGGFYYYGDPDLNDTWEFSAGQWTNVTNSVGTPPTARDAALFVDDPLLGSIVLFGGFYTLAGASQGVDDDTWYFNGTWTAVNTSTTPGARAVMSAAFDAADGYLYLFGGYSFPIADGDSWEYGSNPPIAAIETPGTEGQVGVPIDFSAQVSGGLPPYQEMWNFGDGVLGSGVNVSHVYSAGGTFTVGLTVQDNGSGRATAAVEVNISTGPLTLSPIVTTPVEPVVGQLATLSANVSGGLGPYTWQWEFGDGLNTNTTNSVEAHAFSSAGVYTVNVSVADAHGLVASTSSTVWVVGAALALSPLTVPTVEPVVGAPTAFVATASGGAGSYNWSWSFGDGGSAFIADPTHAYSAVGSYTANVTVRDAAGVTVTRTILVTLVAFLPRLGSIDALPLEPLVGDSVGFSLNVTGGTLPYAFLWNFGDGSTATSANPSHTYARAGTFTVTASLTDRYGAGSNATLTLHITAAPTTGPAPTTPWWIWIGVAAVAVAVGVVAVVLLRRRPPTPPAPR